jgi:hypothetical protein
MKKTFLIFAAVMILASCDSIIYPKNIEVGCNKSKIVFWDETLSKEECVGLRAVGGITVTSYNGVPVNWDNWTPFYLPPGKIILTIDLDYKVPYGYNSYLSIKGTNLPFECTYNAGEVRYLRPSVKDKMPIIEIASPYDEFPSEQKVIYQFPEREKIILE